LGEVLRGAMSAGLMSKIGYLFARGAFRTLRDKMDPRNVNGAVFLGLDGVVIKSHGGTDALGFSNAIGIGFDTVRHQLLGQIRESLAQSGDGRIAVTAGMDARV